MRALAINLYTQRSDSIGSISTSLVVLQGGRYGVELVGSSGLYTIIAVGEL